VVRQPTLQRVRSAHTRAGLTSRWASALLVAAWVDECSGAALVGCEFERPKSDDSAAIRSLAAQLKPGLRRQRSEDAATHVSRERRSSSAYGFERHLVRLIISPAEFDFSRCHCPGDAHRLATRSAVVMMQQRSNSISQSSFSRKGPPTPPG